MAERGDVAGSEPSDGNRAFEELADEILTLIRERAQRGLSLRHLVEHQTSEHGGGRSAARSTLRPVLRHLVARGVVVLGRGKRYFASESTNLVTGPLKLTAGGFGLVLPDADEGEPIRIEKTGLRGAMNGDVVQVRLERARRRARAEGQREGVVVQVLERARTTVVGRWSGGEGPCVVRPVDRRLGVPVRVTASEVDGTPRVGEYVVVAVDDVSRSGQARGRLVERLGDDRDDGVIDQVVLRVFSIEEGFPPLVEAAAADLDGAIGDERLAGRWDLREQPVVTIDPDTARDFDDAVSARAVANGVIEVEVHIADVGAFVIPGSVIDREARERSTSVYLPGRVVPMLPERLSSDLCSLRPQQDRLTMSVRFEVHRDGSLGQRRASPSVIRSQRRLTYGQVAVWIEGEKPWPDDTAAFGPSLRLCHEASKRLWSQRRSRGSLDFDLAEPQLSLDTAGRVTAIEPAPRTAAHRMIEELMIAANRCVAELIIDAGLPTLHRIHDRPDPKRLSQLVATLIELGLEVPWDPETLTVRELQAVLDRSAGLATERYVSTLVLRSLARAVYGTATRGHFALAAEAYCHFTSPIRRYPDLVVHRMLRRLLASGRGMDASERETVERQLTVLGEHCSAREQRAEAAERLAVRWRVVHFLASRTGEVFDGRVSGVTDFGLFVELEQLAVDGLVHIGELDDDYYHHDSVTHTLIGERNGRRFRLGDRLQVQLVKVDVEALKVELGLVGLKPDRHAGGRRSDGPVRPAKGGRPPQSRRGPGRGRKKR